jgi:hypothetical protein
MKERKKAGNAPAQNEQNDPVFCSDCGKPFKGKEENGCICITPDSKDKKDSK